MQLLAQRKWTLYLVPGDYGEFIAVEAYNLQPAPRGANGYDATSSGGSNLGPTSQKLNDAIKDRVAAYRAENSMTDTDAVPADAVTSSGSGLDPHISPRNAELQARCDSLKLRNVHILTMVSDAQKAWYKIYQPFASFRSVSSIFVGGKSCH